jgi:LacI family transcriptional regulator
MGHRRIAILTAPENDLSIGRSRLNGYLRALKDHHIEQRDELIFRMKRDEVSYSLECGYEMAKELLSSLEGKELPDCIYGVSDTLAIGACKALFDAGYRVPEDISVAGFDGLEIARFYHPDIMTVCQPREEMAEETVRILLRMIRGKTVNRRVIFKAQILEGASVRKIQQEDE